MPRQLAIALVTILATLVPSLGHADGPIPTFIGCPAGQAIRGINFVTHSLVCVPVGGDTAPLLARIAALETALESALGTTPCMHTVGTEVFFDGCNVHVRSGSGATDGNVGAGPTVNGLGNLIIGYNEESPPSFPPVAVRTGSHNLVVGPRHTYSSYGGLVAGYRNFITGAYASVSGGVSNFASGPNASVSGGGGNEASGPVASVSGGAGNHASGSDSSVSGGEGNQASGRQASVSGGADNQASGFQASVSGGLSRSAIGDHDWVAGGLFQDE